MAVIRGVLAILVGVIVATVVGAAIDYLKPSFMVNPMEWMYAWPWIFAAAGAIAAVIAVLLYGLWSRPPAVAKPKREPLTKQRAKAASTAKDKVTLSTSSDVPGMPTFEVDRTKQAKPGRTTKDE